MTIDYTKHTDAEIQVMAAGYSSLLAVIACPNIRKMRKASSLESSHNRKKFCHTPCPRRKRRK